MEEKTKQKVVFYNENLKEFLFWNATKRLGLIPDILNQIISLYLLVSPVEKRVIEYVWEDKSCRDEKGSSYRIGNKNIRTIFRYKIVVKELDHQYSFKTTKYECFPFITEFLCLKVDRKQDYYFKQYYKITKLELIVEKDGYYYYIVPKGPYNKLKRNIWEKNRYEILFDKSCKNIYVIYEESYYVQESIQEIEKKII